MIERISTNRVFPDEKFSFGFIFVAWSNLGLIIIGLYCRSYAITTVATIIIFVLLISLRDFVLVEEVDANGGLFMLIFDLLTIITGYILWRFCKNFFTIVTDVIFYVLLIIFNGFTLWFSDWFVLDIIIFVSLTMILR